MVENIETSCDSTDFTPVGTNINFNSEDVNIIPQVGNAENYNMSRYLFSTYSLDTYGKDSSFVQTNGYEYGLIGNSRLATVDITHNAVGAFVFDTLFKSIEGELPKPPKSGLDIETPERKTFWEYLSRIWDQLKAKDRDIWENFWDSIVSSVDTINEKADNFRNAVNPVNADVDIFEHYMDFVVSPLTSVPTNLRPDLDTNSYIMRPLSVELIPPVIEDGEIVRRDLINISKGDYDAIRNIAYGQYLVLDLDGEKEVFDIYELYSSEEIKGSKEFSIYDGKIKIINIEDVNKSEYLFLFKEDTVNSVTEYTEDVSSVNGYEIKTNLSTAEDIVTFLNTSSLFNGKFEFEVIGDGSLDVNIKGLSSMFSRDSISMGDMTTYSPEEKSNGRYVDPDGYLWKPVSEGSTYGEYVPNPALMKYQIQVDGDLTKYMGKSISIYITTGQAYKISNKILSVPNLQINIEGDAIYYLDDNYTFYNNIIEFNKDIFKEDSVEQGITMYCKESIAINDSLFSQYGALVNVRDWDKFNMDNIMAKAVISALLKSLQESGNLEDYNRALNIYYGIPIAPEDSKVYGLFESYEYPVVNIDRTFNMVTVRTNDDIDLHKFVQVGTSILTSSGVTIRVKDVDRANRTVTVDDASKVRIGDNLYINLPNRFKIQSMKTAYDDGAVFHPAYIIMDSNIGMGGIQHIIDVYDGIYKGEKYPEITVYGTDTENDNNYYITKAEYISGVGAKLTLYNVKDPRFGTELNKAPNDRILYNNTMSVDISDSTKGYVHFAWPTHKFLLLWLQDSEEYYISYMDAPIDTILSFNDTVKQYDVLSRNVSVINKSGLPGWNQYGQFRFDSGINEISNIVELTSSIEGAEFGKYFPAKIEYI